MFLILIYSLFLIFAQALNHQVSMQWNPGCHEDFCQKTNKSFINLIYVKSESNEDTLHFLWSVIGIPTFYLFRTNVHTKLYIDWANLMLNKANCIQFDQQPIYKYGIWFPELQESLDNTSDIFPTHEIKKIHKNANYNDAFSLKNIIWQDFRTTSNFSLNTGTLIGYHSYTKTNISLKLTFFETDSRSINYPHMLYTSNSTEFILTLNRSHSIIKDSSNGVTPNIVPLLGLRAVFAESRYKGARNAYSIFRRSDQSKGPMEYVKKRSMDDEYTPGLFEIDEIVSKRYKQSSGYMQWKPIFFDKLDPSYFRDSRPIITQPLQSYTYNRQNATSLPPYLRSIVEDSVFRGLNFEADDTPNSDLIFQFTNITFGDYRNARMPLPSFVESGLGYLDGYHGNASQLRHSQYITWHCVIGWGEPPTDTISSFVILLIILGFGLPSALIFFTYTYGTLKILRNKNAARNLRRKQELDRLEREKTSSSQNLVP